MAVEVFIPKMTDHMEAAEILQWLAAEGDRVKARQPILEVMTDKVAAEVEAPVEGVLKGIRAGLGRGVVVPVGETIAFVAGPEEAVPKLPPLQPAGSEAIPASPALEVTPSAVPASDEPGKVRATPAARAVARQLGVEIASVKGTGPSGRIREEDVRAFAASSVGAALLQPAPSGAAASAPTLAIGFEPSDEWVDLGPIQRVTGERMTESARVPQFTLSVSVNAAGLLAAQEALAERIVAETGEKLSVTALLIKAVALTLKTHPRLNASFEAGRLKLHRRINIGVAVGTDQGLVVPVVRDADQKSLAQVVTEIKALREKARALHLGLADLSGGTITISNLGMYGIDRFTALINPPEAMILAVGRIAKMPVGLADDTIALRPMMNLTLTVDHRVADGLQAAAFLAELKSRIEVPDQFQ